jgi:hypothetical protein
MTRWGKILGSLLAMLSLSTTAHAQDPDGGVRMQPSPYCPVDAVGCNLTDVDFEYHHDAFAGAGFDTGWIPSSGAIQLRFALALTGRTDVTMGGTVVTSWPPALDTQVVGRPGTGHLGMNYGVTLVAQLRFHASILGASYSWEGSIPTPAILSDLAAVAETTFNPFALPGDILRPVTVSDSSARFHLISYGLTDDIISIPGLNGGIAIDMEGALSTSYQTNSIVIANADSIVATDGHSRVFPEEGATEGFGAFKNIVLHPDGTLAYDGTITLYPTVFITLLGFDFDYDIAEIPIHFGAGGMEVMFADDIAHVPLPDVDFSVSSVDFGTVEAATTEHRTLTIGNAGEAPLELSPRGLRNGFNAPRDTIVIMPGESEELDVTFLSTTPGSASSNLQIDTNDPDAPLLFVRLSASVPASDAGTLSDGGVNDDASFGAPFPPQSGGCGCDIATSRSATPLALALAMLVLGLVVRRARRA